MASPSEDHFERVRFIQQEWNFCFSSRRRKYFNKIDTSVFFFTQCNVAVLHVLLLGDRGRPHGGCWGYPRPTSPKSKDAQFFTNNVKNKYFFLSCAFALCIFYVTLSLSEGEQPRRVRALLPRPSDGRGEHLRRLPGCNDHLAVCPGWSSP